MQFLNDCSVFNRIQNFTYDTEIRFDVDFKEEVTGKVLNGTNTLTLHKNSFQLFFEGFSDLEPGKEYKTTVIDIPLLLISGLHEDSFRIVSLLYVNSHRFIFIVSKKHFNVFIHF